MKIRTLLAMALSLTLALASCKKEEEEVPTKLSFTGTVRLDLPKFVDKAVSYTFDIDTLINLKRDDEQGLDIGYYISNPTTGKKDTIYYDGHILNPAFPDAVYTFTVPSVLKTATLMLIGFSDGYYDRSADARFTVVDPRLDGNGSITGFDRAFNQGIFIDSRDNIRYYTVKIDGKEWMRTNLAWKGSGIPYQNAEAMSRIFGRFYTWNEAVNACPEGWRLPSEADWNSLAGKYGTYDPASGNFKDAAASLMGDIVFNGENLWSYCPDVRISNVSGLSFFPCGYAERTAAGFEFVDNSYYSMFWTAEENKQGNALYRYVCEDRNVLFLGDADKQDFAINIRCVR